MPSSIGQNGKDVKTLMTASVGNDMEDGNTPPLLVGVQTCPATFEIYLAVSEKIGNQSTSLPSTNSLGHTPKGCSIIPQRQLLNYISIICDSQNLETTQMTLSLRMDQENVVDNGVLLSCKKNNVIMKFSGKWMELEKNHPE